MGALMCVPRRRDSFTVAYFGIPVSTLVVCEQREVQQSTNYVPDVPILLQDAAFHWDSQPGVADSGGSTAAVSPDSMWIARVEAAINDFVRKSRLLSASKHLQVRHRGKAQRGKPVGKRTGRVFDRLFHSLLGKTPLRAPHFIALLTLFLRKLPEPLLPPLFVRQTEDILRNTDITEASRAQALQKASHQSFILAYPSEYATFQYLKQLVQRHRAELIALEVETLVRTMLRASDEHVVKFMMHQVRPFVNPVMVTTNQEDKAAADCRSASGSHPVTVVLDADDGARNTTGLPSSFPSSDHSEKHGDDGEAALADEMEGGEVVVVVVAAADAPKGDEPIELTSSISSHASSLDGSDKTYNKVKRSQGPNMKQNVTAARRESRKRDVLPLRGGMYDVDWTESSAWTGVAEQRQEGGSEEEEEKEEMAPNNTEWQHHGAEDEDDGVVVILQSVRPEEEHSSMTLEEGRSAWARETQIILLMDATSADHAEVPDTPGFLPLTEKGRHELLPGSRCQASSVGVAVVKKAKVCPLAPHVAMRSSAEFDMGIILPEGFSPVESVTGAGSNMQRIHAFPPVGGEMQPQSVPECAGGEESPSPNEVAREAPFRMSAVGPSGTPQISDALSVPVDVNTRDDSECKSFIERHPRYAALMGAKQLFLGKERLPPPQLLIRKDLPALVAVRSVDESPPHSAGTKISPAEKSPQVDGSSWSVADGCLPTEGVSCATTNTTTTGDATGGKPQNDFKGFSHAQEERWKQVFIQPILTQIAELTTRCESLAQMLEKSREAVIPLPHSCLSRNAVTRVEEEVLHLKDTVHQVAESQSEALEGIRKLQLEIQQQHEHLEDAMAGRQGWQDDALRDREAALEIRRRCADLEAMQLQEHRRCEYLSLKMKDLAHKLESCENKNVHLKMELSTVQRQSVLLREKLMSA